MNVINFFILFAALLVGAVVVGGILRIVSKRRDRGAPPPD